MRVTVEFCSAIISNSIKLLSKSRTNFRNFYSTTTTQTSSANIIQSPHPKITELHVVSIPEIVWSNMPIKEKEIAIECSLSGKKLKYKDIYEQSHSFGAALIQSGVKLGDVVSIISPNIPEYPIAFFGVLLAGGTLSPANPGYTEDEIIRQISISDAKVAITTPQLLPSILAAQKQCPNLKSIIVIGDSGSLHQGCHSFNEMVKVNPQGVEFYNGAKLETKEFVALLPFSSGTTGPPKGVQLTHFNIVNNCLQYTAPNCANVTNIVNGTGQDRLIGVLPFFHSYGITTLLVAGLYAGNHILSIPQFLPDKFIEAMRKHKPTVLTLVPPLISFLANSPHVTKEDFDGVRCIQAGAAPLGKSLIDQIIEKAGRNIFIQNMYGLTETSPGALVLDPKFENTKPGSCGSLLPNTLGKIIDLESGSSLGPNQRGEVCLKGPQIMKGYYKNEKATQEMIDSDGWLHTGDIGYYDEDECFYVVDRFKELIKVKGLQVAPAELEDLLRKHPEIEDVAVIGIPDERSGELPRAYIVPKSKNLTQDQVNAFLNGKISKHKELKGGIEFINIIPKAASGKILRRELKQNYLAKQR